MDVTTGQPSEEALSQLIDSLLNFVILNKLYEVPAPEADAEAGTI